MAYVNLRMHRQIKIDRVLNDPDQLSENPHGRDPSRLPMGYFNTKDKT